MASISCGKCKKTHGSVQDVRACYTGETVEALEEPKATDRQIRFIEKLQAERGMTLISDTDRPSIKEASDLIRELLDMPKAAIAPESKITTADPFGVPFQPPTEPAKTEDWRKAAIPTGYYATKSLTGNNDYDFWKIESPSEGRWVGYTFVKRVIGGHSDSDVPRDSKKKISTERVGSKATQRNAIAAIMEMGIEESGRLFGTELKYCRVCGIHLTDETSRALGIGPTCRDK
jgi:hypothetical protein